MASHVRPNRLFRQAKFGRQTILSPDSVTLNIYYANKRGRGHICGCGEFVGVTLICFHLPVSVCGGYCNLKISGISQAINLTKIVCTQVLHHSYNQSINHSIYCVKYRD